MTAALCEELLQKLDIYLQKAGTTGVINIPCEQAVLTREALHAADAGALRLVGGAR